jgi:hypothetical protein
LHLYRDLPELLKTYPNLFNFLLLAWQKVH